MESNFGALSLGCDIKVSHSFFVDDILIMGMIDRFSWLALYHIIIKFGNPTSLIMNLMKSIILYDTCDMDDIAYIQRPFGVETDTLTGGIKYMGYHIKPYRYRINYWMWLFDKFHKKITGWEFICLSLRVILPSHNV